MLGATVMPHVIYLHGALTQSRYVRSTEAERLALLRSQRVDVVAAMGLAGLINLSMLAVAAENLSDLPVPVDTIEGAYAGIAATLGPTAAAAVRARPAGLRFRGVRGRHPVAGRWSCRDSCGGGSRSWSGGW